MIFGQLTADHYRDAVAADPRIDHLRERMEVREEPRCSRDYLDPEKRSIANAARVEALIERCLDRQQLAPMPVNDFMELLVFEPIPLTCRQSCHPVCPVLLFFNKEVTFRFSERSLFPH